MCRGRINQFQIWALRNVGMHVRIPKMTRGKEKLNALITKENDENNSRTGNTNEIKPSYFSKYIWMNESWIWGQCSFSIFFFMSMHTRTRINRKNVKHFVFFFLWMKLRFHWIANESKRLCNVNRMDIALFLCACVLFGTAKILIVQQIWSG